MKWLGFSVEGADVYLGKRDQKWYHFKWYRGTTSVEYASKGENYLTFPSLQNPGERYWELEVTDFRHLEQWLGELASGGIARCHGKLTQGGISQGGRKNVYAALREDFHHPYPGCGYGQDSSQMEGAMRKRYLELRAECQTSEGFFP